MAPHCTACLSFFPACPVGGDVAFGAFLEREGLGVLGCLRSLPGLALVNGVYAVHNEAVGRVPLLAGFLEEN